jgi:uncharacterized protein (TIGR02452 family)
VNGEKIDIKDELEQSLRMSTLHRGDEFSAVSERVLQQVDSPKFDTVITVHNMTVLEAAARMTADGSSVGCLNFASAKNPGGGFLNGALAQEESLAVSSSLYATQMKNYDFYKYHQGLKTYLYSDHMIYSPDVVVFRDDEGDLLQRPYKLSIVTSPATNTGAIRTNKPGEMAQVEKTMLRRMDKVLGLFVYYGINRLLLGAWGCGVFHNDPAQIATWFASYLKEGGKYHGCFEEVVFAVYDRSKSQENIHAFKSVF